MNPSSMTVRRYPPAITISFMLHAGAVATAVWVAGMAPARVPAPRQAMIFNVSTSLPVPVFIETKIEPVEPPAPILKAEPVAELPSVPEPKPVPELRREQPEAPPAEPARPEPARPEPVRPEPVRDEPARAVEPVRPKPAPQVLVGLFQQNPVPSTSLQPAREARVAGFDAPEARQHERNLPAATAGAFDNSAGGGSPQQRRADQAPRTVVAAGFSAATSGPAGQRSAQGVVRDAGFDAAPAAQQGARRRQEPVDVPVEVLFKPTPAYSSEARALKIEGEVALEVEFLASTKVRVIRVLSGLGHGLDEAAVEAAEQIRFKPAQSAGQPVDFRATVHIVFKLV